MKNDEEIFALRMRDIFTRHFHVDMEVWSKCRTKRIDMVLTYQNKYHFGIECKIPDKKKGEMIARYVKQAIGYSKLEWSVPDGTYKKMPILLCPPLSYKYFLMNDHEKVIDGQLWHKDRHFEEHEHHSFNGFLGALGIGEVRKLKNGYQFAFSNKPLFATEKYHNGKGYVNMHVINYDFIMSRP
jgi:hypothetical protein